MIETGPIALDSIRAVADRPGTGIDIWSADLDGDIPASRLQDCSAAEQVKAEAFPSPRDGKRFLASRAILRAILAAYTRRPAADIMFAMSGEGKPLVEGGSVRFNLSHTGGKALLAVRAAGEVGVDIQAARAVSDPVGVARALFAREEFRHLVSLHGAARNALFFRLWTAREAVFKAVGRAMTAGHFVLERCGDEQFQVTQSPSSWGTIGLRMFRPGPGADLFGAVAWQGGNEAPYVRLITLDTGDRTGLARDRRERD